MMSADFPTQRPLLAPPGRPRRDRLVVAGLVALFALGLYGISRATDWADIAGKLMQLSILQGVVLLALSLVNYLLRAARWHLFARSLGLRVSGGTSLLHYFGGFAMSVTPGKLGELVRIRWLSRTSGVALERAAPAALADRALDLAALAVLLAVCLALSSGIRGGVPVACLALAAAFAATHPKLLAWLAAAAHRLTGRRLPRLFARLRRAALSLEAVARGGVLLPALGFGLAGWMAEGYAFHLLLGWFGADIGLARALAIFIFATLAGGLTGAPGGLGGAEAAMVALLSFDGVPLETSVAATAIIRFTTLWFAVLIGMIAFPIAERRSQGGLS
jgi:uncharacterized protein (TIRG00374 family)